jgi:ATPases of the AAA+ class
MNFLGNGNDCKTHRVDLHVEAMIHPCCTLPLAELQTEIKTFLAKNLLKEQEQEPQYHQAVKLDLTLPHVPKVIQESCIQISLEASSPPQSSSRQTITKTTTTTTTTTTNTSPPSLPCLHIHPYTLTDVPSEPEEIEEPNEEPITVCDTLSLPHTSLHTLWEHLILPLELKHNLLNYAQSAILFSNKRVSPHIIGWNRVLLLYGPPGTGKTSLCRALAQKLSIRCKKDYFPAGGYLLEIKSHSLFSKWFSESGKLMSRLFGRIREMVEDEPDALFFVLMDEVESLANSRVGSGSGGYEPSDSIRAVNSLLTSLDSIRQYRNVMILSTSNMTDCVDGAFVDRVDWMVKVDLPCLEARYEILKSCVEELMRVGIVKQQQQQQQDGCRENVNGTCRRKGLVSFHEVPIGSNDDDDNNTVSGMLLECARMAEGLSGRSLRRIPFQSHAFHVHSIEDVSLEEFLRALKIGIERKVKGDI